MKLKKKAILNSLRIFGLILHKCWLVSRRRWFVTLFGEILFPISLIFLGWMLIEKPNTNNSHISETLHYDKQSFEQLINLISSLEIRYTSSNSFTDELITMVVKCLKNKASIVKFITESELVANPSNDLHQDTIGIIFDESTNRSSKHLNYKFRLYFKDLSLYSSSLGYVSKSFYKNTFIAQVQICLDQSFIQIISGKTWIDLPKVYIQRIPYPANERHMSHGTLLDIIFIMLGLMISTFIETLKATKEKYAGINILMSMNGISNTLNLLSWIITGMAFLSVFCITAILFNIANPSGRSCIFLNKDNSIIFVVFICYLAHALALNMHVSSYFSKSLHLTYGLIILNGMMLLFYMYLMGINDTYLTPYVGMFIPMALLCQAIKEIDGYKVEGVDIEWSSIFVNADPEVTFGGTVGMILILFAVGTVSHFLLSIYVQKINPGKFCVGVHPLFFLKRENDSKEDENSVDNLIYDDVNNKYFEPTSTDINIPGIQIRNLEKAYDIGLFNRQKVHALRGISVDFHKGRITSLLGHNGAGKSTLMAVLAGLVRPSSGSILIDSKNMKNNAPVILKNVGFFAQEDVYFLNLTVTEQLEFFAMIKMLDKSRFAIRENVRTLIQKLKLVDVKDFLPNNLSEDQKRKLCLGMAFVGNPSTLILDEPTSRMDHENKHLIWNILLEMRGQKTILISTHDMEEADMLGDRIAIMHEGRLKSYGTSLYLKKMIAGQYNIDVTFLVERWSDPDRIRAELDNEANIIDRQDRKMVVSVPISALLTGLLDKLDKKKKDLGICSYSLAHIGLEQVFIKVAEDNGDHCQNQHEVVTRGNTKLKGLAGYLQSVRGLLVKKFKCTLKDWSSIKKQLVLLIINLLAVSIAFTMNDVIFGRMPKIRLLQLDLYDNPYTYYQSSDEIIAGIYKSICTKFDARSLEITETNLDNALMQLANEDLIHYNNHLIAAAEFNKTGNNSIVANAFYSETISYSLPISINLIGNTILKNLVGSEYSIATSSQSMPYAIRSELLNSDAMLQGYAVAIIFASFLYFAIAMFAIHPCRENSGGLKHLQKMTGVSGFTYWATTFLVDMMHWIGLIVLLVIGLVCMDQSLSLQSYEINEIMIQILLMMLLAVNVLPLVYSFTFINIKTSTIVLILIFISIGLVIVECVLLVWKIVFFADEDKYSMLRMAYLLIPYVSFMHGQEHFQIAMAINAFCRRLPDDYFEYQCKQPEGYCCDKTVDEGGNRYEKKFRKFVSYFLDDDMDSLKISVIYLCLTPILYFGILTFLESRIIPKLLTILVSRGVLQSSLDEEVQREKSMVFERMQELKQNENIEEWIDNPSKNPIFLAYELRKQYLKVRAVEDVNFSIKRSECYGIFGVNRSGKSTILEMIIGQAIPNGGVMYIDDKDFEKNKKYFLSQIGYCPQHDVSLKCLNSYDHLRLFARIRGIPEDQVENEVQFWIERLDLVSCAPHPTDTYSSGNKQRLNIAMALIGNSKLLLLDEPTTRMDPGARLSFWNTIKSLQPAGQTVLLASNKMEECEALCNRMSIIADGKFICIGTPENIKQRFGAGYDVQIRINPSTTRTQISKIKKDMRLLLHCVLTNENSNFLMYHVVGAGTTWSKMYEVMNRIKLKYDCIDDFLVVVRLSNI